jgi:tetratricopeptide (TPR) repeat protein
MANSLAKATYEKFDCKFYGIWHEDLHHLSASQLEEHWASHGEKEGRIANSLILSREMFWPISKEEWSGIISEIDGLMRSEARQKLLQFIQKRLTSASGVEQNPSLKSLDFDPEFYRCWYSDLTKFNLEQLKDHWVNNGQNEQRFGSFLSMIEAEGYEADDLPGAFNPEGYAKLNKSVKQKGSSVYSLAYHFLKTGKEKGYSYYFDPYFYSAFYSDLGSIRTFSGHLGHFKKYGYKEDRFPNMEIFLLSNKGESLLSHFQKGLDIDSVLNRNRHLTTKDLSDTICRIVRFDKYERIRLYKADENNAEFYSDLASFYMEISAFEKAIKAFYTSLSFAQNRRSFECLGLIYNQHTETKLAHEMLKKAIELGSGRLDVINTFLSISQESTSFDDLSLVLNTGSNYDGENRLLGIAEQLWSVINAKNKVLAAQNSREHIERNTSVFADQVRVQFSNYYNRFSTENHVRTRLNRERVTIIGDYFIPQCIRYRIDQKKAQLELAGMSVNTVDWTKDLEELNKAICFSDIILFYRCPGLPKLLQIAEKAKSLGKVCVYDIDDLIFTQAFPSAIESYASMIDADHYCELVRSFHLYAEMAKSCHYSIASTRSISDKLENLVQCKKGYVHRNALDKNSLVREKKHSNNKKTIDIFYGSATLAHNADFTEALLPVLIELLENHSHLRLIVVGHLSLGSLIPDSVIHQVKTVPYISDTRVYLEVLGESDINLAVLDRDEVTDGKSEIKWLEAAALGIPSVVSATANYLDVIQDGRTGFVAHSPSDWKARLSALITNEDLRNTVGNLAKAEVEKKYSEELMATQLHETLMTITSDFEQLQ